MTDIIETPTTRRDVIAAAFDDAEKVIEPIIAEPVVAETDQQKADRLRDEGGRFAKAPEAAPVESLKPPTTWKKEYLGLWEKLNTGTPLTAEESKKLAQYAGHEREGQFASGVSTYKAEAENAKELNGALAPFAQKFQQYGVKPSNWIKTMGNIHLTLVEGTPEQKLSVIRELAHAYRIPLQYAQSGQLPQELSQVYSTMQTLQQGYQTLTEERKAEKEAQIVQILNDFAKTHEHYDKVKPKMGQLLGSGSAATLDEAYDTAIWSDPELRKLEMEKLQAPLTQKSAVQKAKSQAISVKSSTPSGQASSGKKDRRAMIEEAFNDHVASRV